MAHHPDIQSLGEGVPQTPPRYTVGAVYGATFLAGLYAAISPWVVGFQDRPSLTVTDLIVGLGVALLALGLASLHDRVGGMAWVIALMGVWLIVSPWIVRDVDRSTGLLVSNIVVGAVILLLGLAASGMEMMPRRR